MNQRLQRDVALMITQHCIELLVNVLDEGQKLQARDGIYEICLAGLEAFCLQDDRMRRRQWLEGTSFLDTALQEEKREELILETFELSRQIGYAHFLAENFDHPNPELVRRNPEERKAFLRQ